MRLFTTFTILAITMFCVGAVHADLIPDALTGVTGKAFHQGDSASGNGSISRMLDGNGLTVGNPNDSSTWTHNNAWQANWQGQGSFSNGNTPGAWFVVDLGTSVSNLGDAYVWNVRERLDRGVKDVELFYAESPTVTPTTGSSYDFTSGGWTSLSSLIIDQATGNNTPVDTIIDLSGISSARYIGFDINTNYGHGGRVGFAEIQFTTADPVPEPSTFALAALGLLGMGWFVRRKRK